MFLTLQYTMNYHKVRDNSVNNIGYLIYFFIRIYRTTHTGRGINGEIQYKIKDQSRLEND